jgi:hypothetical protein
MKIRPVGAELLQVDGRTGTRLIVASRNFANAPNTLPITVNINEITFYVR